MVHSPFFIAFPNFYIISKILSYQPLLFLSKSIKVMPHKPKKFSVISIIKTERSNTTLAFFVYSIFMPNCINTTTSLVYVSGNQTASFPANTAGTFSKEKRGEIIHKLPQEIPHGLSSRRSRPARAYL
jgi:hypothetical protein